MDVFWILEVFWILGSVLSQRTTVHEAHTAAQPRTQGFPRTPPSFFFFFQRKALGTRSTAVGAHLRFHLPAASNKKRKAEGDLLSLNTGLSSRGNTH